MTLRFRRSLRLAPGVRLNFSRGAPSLSLGPRGASVTIGRRGVFGNVGIPGTGLATRARLDGGGRGGYGSRPTSRRGAASERVLMSARITLHEDGSVALADADGTPFTPEVQRLALKENAQVIRAWLNEHAESINAEVDRLLNLHLATPAPRSIPAYEKKPFARPMPERPKLHPISFWVRLIPPLRRRYQTENDAEIRRYDEQRSAWRDASTRHAAQENQRLRQMEEKLCMDPVTMESFLGARLAAIPWSRDTQVSFDVSDVGKRVLLDVDLPEIEDMPAERARPAAKGDRLIKKALSEREQRLTYMTHVHAVGFRLIGEVFAALPTVEQVAISGFSQRTDPATGQERDDYLYSVRVSRTEWSAIDFASLGKVDPVEALGRFELRRDMTKTGIFRPVAPFEAVGS